MPKRKGSKREGVMQVESHFERNHAFRGFERSGTVVEAIRIGAHDYLTKPFRENGLDAAMLKSRQKRNWRRRIRRCGIYWIK